MSDTYSMSFTSGALLQQESLVVARIYLEFDDIEKTKSYVINQNLLQTRTVSTLKRLCNEIMHRLNMLSRQELKKLISVSERDQACLLWVAICRYYEFIKDFAIEVLNYRFNNLKRDLPKTEFDRFFEQKSLLHKNLDKLSLNTKAKLKQILFKMLKELDFIDNNLQIQGVILSKTLCDILSNNPEELTFFPVIIK